MEPTSHAGSQPACPYAAGLIPLHGRAREQDLDAVYVHLRRHGGPVVAVEIAPGVAAWLALNHREVLEVIWNVGLYSSDPAGGTPSPTDCCPRTRPCRPCSALVRLSPGSTGRSTYDTVVP